MIKKSYRIKKSEEIAEICKYRKKVHTEYFYIFYRKGKEVARVAFSVNKHYGVAVERNYAKRILRKAVHDNIPIDTAIDMVVVAKPTLKNAKYEEIANAMKYCLKVMKKYTQSEENKNENK